MPSSSLAGLAGLGAPTPSAAFALSLSLSLSLRRFAEGTRQDAADCHTAAHLVTRLGLGKEKQSEDEDTAVDENSHEPEEFIRVPVSETSTAIKGG